METQKTETKRLLNELRTAAIGVAADDQAKREAIVAERVARAELLAAVVDAIRPALSALSAPIPLDSHGAQRYPKRGLHVGWDKGAPGKFYPPGPVVSPGAADPRRGRYAGRDLFLLEEGCFLDLAYDGPWSTVPGELCSWETAAMKMSSTEALANYDLGPILDSITADLAAQASGNNRKVAKRAGELAQRLGAIALLVRTS